jgi:DNA-binding GntR family transcriptional regulator
MRAGHHTNHRRSVAVAVTREVNRAVTKREFAYREIRDLIMDGTLEPGTRLSLRPLAERLGVSVMPVRDALRALETEGLVETSDHQGAYVASVSRAEILEVVSIRMWLEVYAVMRAAEIQDRKSLEEARRALAAGEKAMEQGSGLKFTQANRQFHEAIEAPVDGLATDMIQDLWNRLWQVRRQGSLFVLLPERMKAAHAEHEDILVALERGNPKAAGKAAERHRETTLRAWEEAFGSS